MNSPENPSEIASQTYHFGDFTLNVVNRQLLLRQEQIELKPRYFDALVLLVRESGHLIEKERFFSEVWADTIVSDHALTQCIKDIRKALNDQATNPTFIQTVPRHGYRFVGDVTTGQSPSSGRIKNSGIGTDNSSAMSLAPPDVSVGLTEWLWAIAGGAVAGLLGGMFYGFGLASPETGLGTLSTLLVLISLNVIVGATGGLGVGLGLATSGLVGRRRPKLMPVCRIIGATVGGMFVGGLVRLLGVDAFNLLLGTAPDGITGGREGAILGFLVTTGAFVGWRVALHTERRTGWGQTLGGGIGGALAGGLIPLTGGNLFGGSLHLLTNQFAQSRLELDTLGELLGGLAFDLTAEAALASVEGCLFGLGIFGALSLASQLSKTELFR